MLKGCDGDERGVGDEKYIMLEYTERVYEMREMGER